MLDIAARKLGMGTRPQRVLFFTDGLRLVEPRRLATVTVAEVHYRDISAVSLQKGLIANGMTVKRRRGRPLVLHALLPRDASKAKAFIEKRLSVRIGL